MFNVLTKQTVFGQSETSRKLKRRNKNRWIKYDALTGEKALNLMRELQARNCRVIAETNAHGITEHLALSDMEAIFGE